MAVEHVGHRRPRARPRGPGAHRVGRRPDAGPALDPRAPGATSARSTASRVAACLHVTAETANLVRALIAGRRRGGAVRRQPALHPGRDRGGAGRGLRRRGPRPPRRGRRAPTPPTWRRARARRPHVTLDDGADLVIVLHHARPALRERLIGGDRGDDHRPAARARARGRGAARRARSSPSTRRTPSASSTTTTAPASRRSTASCARPTSCSPGRPSSSSATAGPGAAWPSARAAPARRSSSARSIPCARWRRGWRASRSCPRSRRPRAATSSSPSPARARVLRREHFERMKDGAMLANAGHFDVEIDLDAPARGWPSSVRDVLPLVAAVRPRRAAPEPAGLRARRQPRRRPGPSGRGHGHVLRPAGARRRGPRARAARELGAGRAPGARGDRPRGRAPQARRAGRRASTSSRPSRRPTATPGDESARRARRASRSPRWRPGFYPAGTRSEDFLRFYAGVPGDGRGQLELLPPAQRRDLRALGGHRARRLSLRGQDAARDHGLRARRRRRPPSARACARWAIASGRCSCARPTTASATTASCARCSTASTTTCGRPSTCATPRGTASRRCSRAATRCASTSSTRPRPSATCACASRPTTTRR